MKFAHMADLHLGGWRDPELERINLEAFEKAMDTCLREQVDFILISGDFFDTSMPPFDILDFVSKKLNDVKLAGIPVYSISGSHDYSPSGKTILKVLENAELLINVAKGDESGEGKIKLRFVTDKKTGAKIMGIFGKKGALEEEFYKQLDRSIEDEQGYKIFLFHSGIAEFRPDYLKDVPAMPLSLLPKGFDYYAGGHIHHRNEQVYGKGKVVFPGPLFPCNFQELERFGNGGFYIIENGSPRFIDINNHDVKVIKADAKGKSAKEVESELLAKVESLGKATGDACFILLIRVSGTLNEGKPSEINFRKLTEDAQKRGALVVRRNTNALSSLEYEEVKVSADSIEQLEEKLITENMGKSKMKGERGLISAMMKALDVEKMEGETTATFEARLLSEADTAVSESHQSSHLKNT